MFDKISNALGQAATAVVDVLQDAGDQLGDIAQDAFQQTGQAISDGLQDAGDAIGDGVSKMFDKQADSFDGGFGFDDVLGVFEGVMSGGLGKGANELLDRLGLPDCVGDIVGVAVDVATGNVAGAVINGLDAAEDIAHACGQDEIAGFLKTGAEVGNAIAGLAGSGALASVGGAALGPGVAGALDKVIKGADVIRGGLDAADKAAKGDWAGAAGAAFGALTNFNQVGDAIGVSQDVLDVTQDIADQAAPIFDFISKASADGSIDLADVKYLPVADALQANGVDIDGFEPLVQGALDFASGIAAGDDPADAIGGLFDAAFDTALGQLADDINPEELVLINFVKDLATTGQTSPETAKSLLEVFSRAAESSQELDVQSLCLGGMRM